LYLEVVSHKYFSAIFSLNQKSIKTVNQQIRFYVICKSSLFLLNMNKCDRIQKHLYLRIQV